MTPGPWRWADWRAQFGTLEGSNRNVLESKLAHGDAPGPVVREREDEVFEVIRLDEPTVEDYDPDDVELIRRAPELRHELLSLVDEFAGVLGPERVRMLRDLAIAEPSARVDGEALR